MSVRRSPLPPNFLKRVRVQRSLNRRDKAVYASIEAFPVVSTCVETLLTTVRVRAIDWIVLNIRIPVPRLRTIREVSARIDGEEPPPRRPVIPGVHVIEVGGVAF